MKTTKGLIDLQQKKSKTLMCLKSNKIDNVVHNFRQKIKEKFTIDW